MSCEQMPSRPPLDPKDYNNHIAALRPIEFPNLTPSTLYFDHAGTTLPSTTLLNRFHRNMTSLLLGNPHSASPSSQASASLVEDVRTRLLAFFNADPDVFDLVFVANATAGIKVVGDGLRDLCGDRGNGPGKAGFWYGYHVDSHTSLVGVREMARGGSRCFEGDGEIQEWIDNADGEETEAVRLFGWPAQSNMNGRRLPLKWSAELRRKGCYSLLDAAGLVSTSALDLSDVNQAPDFTVLSLYKIFGFPDLGALIVRKDCAHLFDKRTYFGGGTVDMVVCSKEQWHAPKTGPLHERLEDGTLPIHSILALKCALQTHGELFGTLDQISQHTSRLALHLYDCLKSMRHGNDQEVCKIYEHANSQYGDTKTQGPIVAFNLRDSKNNWVSNTEVEKLAAVRDIHLRTGGVCNPGGIATSLGLAAWEMNENFSAGHRCGSENDILNGKPTGVIRASLGAMSTEDDVERFVEFIDEFFVDKGIPAEAEEVEPQNLENRLYVETLTVYPIKSCAGWSVPEDTPWDIRHEGLAWDREWCLVHQGTGKALSQKQHPQMALLRPALDLKAGVLRIFRAGLSSAVEVPLSKDPNHFKELSGQTCSTTVCGEKVHARVYASPEIASFFTAALDIPCTLARFPATTIASTGARHMKSHLQTSQFSESRTLLLSNESPILTITRSSINRLNETIKSLGGKAVLASAFRANIVLAESPSFSPGEEKPWIEDNWTSLTFKRQGKDGGERARLDVLGGCRRCQMVCIDQGSGERNPEPFVTLAKVRRFAGRGVLFGVHCCLHGNGEEGGKGRVDGRVKVGDEVETVVRERE